MLYRALLALCLLCSSVGFSTGADAQRRGRRTPRVAIIVDGPADLYRETIDALTAEAVPLLQGTYADFEFGEGTVREGDFTQERANALLAEALADRDVSLVIGLGLEVGRAVGATEDLSKPVLLPFAAPRLQGLPREGAVSGRQNLFYMTGLFDLPRDLRRFRDVIRRERVAVLVEDYIVDALPNAEATLQASVGETMQLQLISVGRTAEAIAAAIPEDAEAVYLGPMPRLPSAEIAPLIEAINARNLPTYASVGRRWVELGAFTTLVPEDERQRRLRRTALVMDDALRGADLATTSTAFERRAALVINMATARRIRMWPSFELMTEAELLNADDNTHGRALSFRQAVREGIERNLALQAREQDRVIADAQYDEALGTLAPTINLNAQAAWIDPDGAGPFGRAEREISYGVEAQQILYSPRATSGLRAARAAQAAVGSDVDSIILDTVQSVGRAYLDVLRARTGAEVNRENLSRARQNLALAEVRVDIGAAGPQEVFRWEIEIAEARAAVIQAIARRNQAELQLNRLLNRPQEETLNLAEPIAPDTGIVVSPEVAEYVGDPWSFGVFRDFMVNEAMENAPELRQLEQAIETQEQLLVGQRQELYVPDLLLTGGINHTPGRWGTGSQAPPADPSLPFPARDNFSWQVGLVLQFNVFDLSRYARIDQTSAQVRQLGYQRESVSIQIEQRTRSALHAAGASSATVRLRQDAAEAARSNLELVVEAYRQGAVNVVTLIDAQNQYLSARLAAANAVYDFLSDFIDVERAAGRFSFLSDEEDNRSFIRRLAQFTAERREGETP